MKVEPRALTAVERAVLGRILAEEFPGVAALREQAVNVLVVGQCDCGCPSVDLDPQSGIVRPIRTEHPVPIELQVDPGDGESPARVILFVRDGTLSYLELVHYSDSPPSSWPAAERLNVLGL